MEYSIEFRHLAPGFKVPSGSCQDHPITVKPDEFALIPVVGDSVIYSEDGRNVARKVLTRDFVYSSTVCVVTIVVGDMTVEESLARNPNA